MISVIWKIVKLLIHHVSWVGRGDKCAIEWGCKNKKKNRTFKMTSIDFYRRTVDRKEEANNVASCELT